MNKLVVDPENLVGLLLSSWSSLWGLLALSLPAGKFLSLPGGDFHTFGHNDVLTTGFTLRNPAANPATHIKEVLERIGSRPITWFMSHALHGYKEELAKQGFVKDLQMEAMTLRKQDWVPEQVLPLGFQLFAVRSERHLRDWLICLQDVYSIENQTIEDFYHAFSGIGLGTNSPFQLLLGRQNGKPICCGAVLNSPGVSTLQFIGTLEGHRNRGFASHLTEGLLEIAFQSNSLATLHATPMGLHLYERAGFARCDTHVAYIKE